MTTLQDLKTKYQAEVERAIAQSEADHKAVQTLRQLKLDGLKPRIIQYLAQREGVDPAELEQGELEGQWIDYEDNKLNYAIFILALPEHQQVSFTFYEDSEGKMRSNNSWWNVAQSGKSPKTLGQALTLAEDVYRQNLEYQTREEADSQTYKAQKEAQALKEQAELADTFKFIASDPVAQALVKLFQAVQAERAGLQEQLDSANYYYQEEVASTRRYAEEKAQRYQNEISRANDNARSLQYRVDDLESDLSKVKKQQKGGW